MAERGRALPGRRRERPAGRGQRRRARDRGQPHRDIARDRARATRRADRHGDRRDRASVTVADPGALADRSDQTFWRGKLPTATVTDALAAATGAAGQTFALLTTNGGALVFYTDAADLQITPQEGSVVHLTVPGFYSDAQGLSRAGLGFLDQFAAADPPGRRRHPAHRRRVLRPHRQELTRATRAKNYRWALMTLDAPRPAPRYCNGASREGEVKSPPRYLKVTSSGSGSPQVAMSSGA